MLPFTKKIIEIISSIPEGKVATYGQIAKLAGNPQAARQVARILHSSSKKHKLPWHRVINVKGQIVIKDEAAYQEQILSLEAEGVEVDSSGKVDLKKYQAEI